MRVPSGTLPLLLVFLLSVVGAAGAHEWRERRMAVDEADHEWTLFENDRSELTVAFVCGMHARELLATRLCREWVATLRASLLGTCQPALRFAFLTAANPEGAHLAASSDRCHRGNARGVDLNRNFAPLPFSDESLPGRGAPPPKNASLDLENPGPWPMSEKETRAIDRALRSLWPVHVLFNVHWGTNALLAPYDAAWQAPPNGRDLLRFARWLAQAPVLGSEETGDEVVCSTGARAMYKSVGTLTDYAHYHLGVPLAYTLEAAFSNEINRQTSDCGRVFGLDGRSDPHWRAWYASKWEHLLRRLCSLSGDDLVALRPMVYPGNASSPDGVQKDRPL